MSREITYHLVVKKQGQDAQQIRKRLAKALATGAPAFPATVQPSDATLLVEVTLTSDYTLPPDALARHTAPSLKAACAAAGVGYVWGYAEGPVPADALPLLEVPHALSG